MRQQWQLLLGGTRMHDLINTIRYLHALAIAALDDLTNHINRDR